MRTEQIVYLNDIAQTHSIAQTAARLFISPQALSFSIKKLEDEFGLVFLNRTNRGVELTETGEMFLQKARSILNIYDELKESCDHQTIGFTEEEPLETDTLHILGHTRVLEPLLIDVLDQFVHKYPQITITLQEKEKLDIIEAISQEEADFGLIFMPASLLKNPAGADAASYQLPKFVFLEELFSDQFVLCCNTNHPLRSKKMLQAQDFTETPIVLFDTNPYMMYTASEDCPTPAAHRYYSNNLAFHKTMIRRGLAVSIITAFEFRKLYMKHKDLIALPLPDSPKSAIDLVTNTKKPLKPAAQRFINMLRKYNFYSAN